MNIFKRLNIYWMCSCVWDALLTDGSVMSLFLHIDLLYFILDVVIFAYLLLA